MNNALWAMGTSRPHSPYLPMVRGYRKMQERLLTKKPTPPDAVCQRILALSTMRNPPLRSYCGRDALLTQGIHASAPRNWIVRLLRRIYVPMFVKIAK
jgi:hypothetical protein